MNISNITQFVSFISDNNLTSLDSSLQQVQQCFHSYATACSCYNQEDKIRLYNSCNKAYIQAVSHVIPRFRNEFLSKTTERQISFYSENGQLLFILSR